MSLKNDLKHWTRDLFRYPIYHSADTSYDEYWTQRDMGSLNSFQKYRADFLLKYARGNDSILDIGCGDGRILAYLKGKNSGLQLSGIDSSQKALEVARGRGLDAMQGDLRDLSSLSDHSADYVVLFEVLEHMADSEKLLAWACEHARKAVVFSVPNTGFIMHRLRLLFGRFPLQWRAHPAEHLRFWTMRDMHWWLCSLGYRYEVHAYEGVPALNRIWPALFAAGLIVRVLRDDASAPTATGNN